MHRRHQRLQSTFLVLACGSIAAGQSAGTFAPTGPMTTPRYGHTATLLYNGKVLIAGGDLTQPGPGFVPSLVLVSAELYDPSTGTFTATGDMTAARVSHTATLLPNGKVLIAGGLRTRSAEVYDPSTGTFIATGDMVTENVDIPVNAVLLADGKVLITHDGTAELYDSVSGTFSATAGSPSPLLNGGPSLLATLLDNGRVLLANDLYAELYDPASGTFGLTGAPNPGVLCSDGFAGAPLTNGKVLVAGGYCEDINPGPSAGAELYDPSTGTFTPTGDMTGGRDFHTATPLGDGTVLIAGGMPIAVSTTAELYDPATGMFSRTGNMTTSRFLGHTSTLLLDGTVLIAGGVDNGSLNGGVLASAELYKPSVPVPAPVLFSISANGQGQGAIWHATSGVVASSSNPAVAGEILSMYTTSLADGGVIPPQVAMGGRLSDILYFGDAPGYPGYYQVNFRVPSSVTPGATVPVRLTYLGRPSNAVTIGVQ